MFFLNFLIFFLVLSFPYFFLHFLTFAPKSATSFLYMYKPIGKVSLRVYCPAGKTAPFTFSPAGKAASFTFPLPARLLHSHSSLSDLFCDLLYYPVYIIAMNIHNLLPLLPLAHNLIVKSVLQNICIDNDILLITEHSRIEMHII